MPSDYYNPVYAYAVLIGVTLFAWPLSYVLPFYRRALRVEDRTRLTPLDGLRGILCFAVVVHHGTVTHSYLNDTGWGPTGHHFYDLLGSTSVALFFCVTAFLFWSRAIDRSGDVEPFTFLLNRVFRVGPMFVVAGLFAETVVAPALTVSWETASHFGCLLLLGTQVWSPFGSPSAFTANAQVTWSLQYEWGFYLLLPAIAATFATRPVRLLLVPVGCAVMFGLGPWLYFAPGILAAYAARHPPTARRLRGPYAAVLVVVAAATLPYVTSYGMSLAALVPSVLIFVPIACGNTLWAC